MSRGRVDSSDEAVVLPPRTEASIKAEDKSISDYVTEFEKMLLNKVSKAIKCKNYSKEAEAVICLGRLRIMKLECLLQGDKDIRIILPKSVQASEFLRNAKMLIQDSLAEKIYNRIRNSFWIALGLGFAASLFANIVTQMFMKT